MRKLYRLLLFLSCASPLTSQAQTFWTENFDAVACAANCALPYSGANGNWTQVTISPPGDAPNLFFVSCAENGQAAGVCGAGCGSDNSLHVGSNPGIFGDIGAAYYSGDGGLGFADATTDIRAESPTINCTGQFGITLAFNYIENGQTTIDNAQLWYFDGATWSMLFDIAKSPLCGSGQGLWTAYSIVLPASADNNPLVKIGFSWENDNDAGGTDPSFAVDDITLTVTASPSPTAGFTFLPASPCTGQVVTFTNTSSGGTGALSYAWTFAGGTPPTSTATNPTCTFATAGPHTVTLIVTDGAGQDDTITQTVNVVSCAGPTAGFTFSPASPCTGTPVTFTNTSSGGTGALTYAWTFPSGTPATSTATNPSVTWAAPGTYTVTLITTDGSGNDDTTTQSITVVSCPSPPPVASFSITTNPLCAGSCTNFTNSSTSSVGTFTSAWSFPGGSPASSTSNNPGSVCYSTPGSYVVTLIVTDANGSDTAVMNLTVNSCSFAPVANFNAPDTICMGQCINLTDLSSNTPTSWTWSFTGATPSSSTSQNPTGICYNTLGTFTISLTASNASGSNSTVQNITVINCQPPNAAFTTNATKICLYDCLEVNNTTINGTTYLWLAPGAEPDTSTLAEPGEFCYDTAGVFVLSMIAYNPYGSDTFTKFIIVDTLPIIEAFPDEVGLTLGDSVILSVISQNPNVDVAWYTTDTASLGDTTLWTVEATPTTPYLTTYYVYVTGSNGCANVDSVKVYVELTDVVAVPNAFSPNGDGYNDYLNVLGPGVESMHIVIYNRYGQLVFESSDQLIGWDGTHNGKNADTGVFAWFLEYKLVNGFSARQKGNVTLIR